MKNEALFRYLLRLGDDSLILGQRLAEWCGHGPILEEDIAMTNISLDLIGQAMSILDYAGVVEEKGRDCDKLGLLRFEKEYVNVLLVEQPNGDFGDTLMRQFLFDAFRKPLYERLVNSSDKQLAAIADKSLKETRYHLKHSSEWIIRLGDGTEESHTRVQNSLDILWRYSFELFYSDEVETELTASGILPDLSGIRSEWEATVNSVFQQATITIPSHNWKFEGGRLGRHSEHFGHLLSELQYMQRAYPNSQW